MKNRLKEGLRRLQKDVREYFWVVVLFLGYYFLVKKIFHAFCPMVIISGLPCPGCGITRAVLFLLGGQFMRSIRANPMGVFWVGMALYWAVCRYILQKKTKWEKALFVLLVAATIAVYGYRMYTLFPERPPMSYTSGNLFAKWIPDYSTWIRRIF